MASGETSTDPADRPATLNSDTPGRGIDHQTGAGSLAVAQYAYPDSRRVLFALALLPGILLEVRPGTGGLPWRDPRRVPLSTGIGLLVIAHGLWVLDDRGVLCRPDPLLQGRAAWHTLTAVSALMLVLHYGTTRIGAPQGGPR